MKTGRQKIIRHARFLSMQLLNLRVTKSILGAGILFMGASALLSASGANAQSADLPEGPGKAFAVQNCSACHGLELVTAQRRSADEWREVISRMIANGDTLTEDQYNEVVAYLGTYLGTDPAASAAPSSASNTEGNGLAARSTDRNHQN